MPVATRPVEALYLILVPSSEYSGRKFSKWRKLQAILLRLKAINKFHKYKFDIFRSVATGAQ